MPDGEVTVSKPGPQPEGNEQLEPPSIAGEHVIPRGVGGDPTGPDPGAPPIPQEDRSMIGSSQAWAVGLIEDAPVTGAGLRTAGVGRRYGDRVFAWLTSGASIFAILLVALIAVFLVAKSWRSIADDKASFLFSTQWDTTPGDLHFGVAGLLYTTVAVSAVALVMAVPIAVGIALFITQYAPTRVARPVAYVVDLLAAIPSIIYGIWGATILAPHLTGVQHGIDNWFGWIPLFKSQGLSTGTVFDAGVVLAIMVLPIITAISRDVFERTPRQNIEAAWALGATKWEMIRLSILPYGRPGVVSGAMLGLGRALGETIAVAVILSKVSVFSRSIFSGGETFASKIANSVSEFNNPASTGAYIAAGLVLFVLTFVVNAAARWIVNRRRDFV
jgi:phosphate transport system permease protein